jgi:hypothetical protein
MQKPRGLFQDYDVSGHSLRNNQDNYVKALENQADLLVNSLYTKSTSTSQSLEYNITLNQLNSENEIIEYYTIDNGFVPPTETLCEDTKVTPEQTIVTVPSPWIRAIDSPMESLVSTCSMTPMYECIPSPFLAQYVSLQEQIQNQMIPDGFDISTW